MSNKTGGFEIKRLTPEDLGNEDLLEGFRKVYELFPREEREPWADVKSYIKDESGGDSPVFLAYAIIDKDSERVVGIRSGWRPTPTSAIADYSLVLQEARRKGAAKQSLAAFMSDLDTFALRDGTEGAKNVMFVYKDISEQYTSKGQPALEGEPGNLPSPQRKEVFGKLGAVTGFVKGPGGREEPLVYFEPSFDGEGFERYSVGFYRTGIATLRGYMQLVESEHRGRTEEDPEGLAAGREMIRTHYAAAGIPLDAKIEWRSLAENRE